MSEYDQTLYEDESTYVLLPPLQCVSLIDRVCMYSNRIDEASTLWDSVSNSRWFAQSSLVLFLNKTDLFRDKLKVSPLAHYMPQYQGDGDWQSASQFMLGHFTALLKNPNKRLYSHFTCATVSNLLLVLLEWRACADALMWVRRTRNRSNSFFRPYKTSSSSRT